VEDERRVIRTEDVLDHRYLTLRLVTERDTAEREFTYVWGTGPDIVYCVPLFGDGSTMLLRQRRYGMEGASLEVPGGHVDEGEEPGAAAARELAEETGLVAASVTHVLTTLLSIKIQQRLHFHVATGLAQGPPAPDVDEQIETVRMPLQEAVVRAKRGEVRHGPSVTALLLAAAERPRGRPTAV
jgi:ADP-ribose pyrophosphatase